MCNRTILNYCYAPVYPLDGTVMVVKELEVNPQLYFLILIFVLVFHWKQRVVHYCLTQLSFLVIPNTFYNRHAPSVAEVLKTPEANIKG